MLFRSATVALNAAQNAGILAAQIIAGNQPDLYRKLEDYKLSLRDKVMNDNEGLKH